MSAMDVGRDDEGFGLGEGALKGFEVLRPELPADFSRGLVAIAPVEDLALVEYDRLVNAVSGDVGLEVGELCALDHGEHVRERVGDVVVVHRGSPLKE